MNKGRRNQQSPVSFPASARSNVEGSFLNALFASSLCNNARTPRNHLNQAPRLVLQHSNDDIHYRILGTNTRSWYGSRALKYIDLAIYECEEEPLPLPLLQALILITHWLLIQGVRGRAWRYLAVAVRSAYELNMHLIDANKEHDDEIQPEQWCDEEERRRAWWAIWEMDVFASVIRRCPTAIDWSQNETFLPAEDETWARGEPQKSCTLRLDLVERYKTLAATGNQSLKAWFIIINSYMKDAQKITSPIGVDRGPTTAIHDRATQATARRNDASREAHRKVSSNKESLNRLRTIQNALQCAAIALPQASRYRHQYLSFGTRERDRPSAILRRLQHSSIYCIHTMTQLTKLMIYKYQIFQNSLGTVSKRSPLQPCSDLPNTSAGTIALEQYSEASDEIVSLIGRSHEDHYKYVNPFLANTLWLAGAVQVLYRELAPLSSSDKGLTNSKFELLSMTYNKFVSYWNMSTTLQKNLEVVESEVENLHYETQKDIVDRSGMHINGRPPPSRKHALNSDGNRNCPRRSKSSEPKPAGSHDNGKELVKTS
jgi:hypothetical protein